MTAISSKAPYIDNFPKKVNTACQKTISAAEEGAKVRNNFRQTLMSVIDLSVIGLKVLKKDVKEPAAAVAVSNIEKTETERSLGLQKAAKTCRAIVLYPDKFSLLGSLLGLARAVNGVVKNYFQMMNRFAKLFAFTQLSYMLTTPADMVSIPLRFCDLVTEKDFNPRLDAILGLVGDVSSVVDGVTTAIEGFVGLNVLAQSVMTWAGPLNTAGNLLSAVFLAISARSLYFSTKVVKDLNVKLKAPSTPDYSGACEVVNKHSYALKTHCGVGKELDKKITLIFKAKAESQAPDAEKNKRCDERLGKLFAALKTRISHKQGSLAVGMVSTKIGILATIIFAFSPLCAPLVIVGCSLLTGMYVTILFRMGFDLYANSIYKRKVRYIESN